MDFWSGFFCSTSCMGDSFILYVTVLCWCPPVDSMSWHEYSTIYSFAVNRHLDYLQVGLITRSLSCQHLLRCSMRVREGRGDVSLQSSPRMSLCGMLGSSGIRKVNFAEWEVHWKGRVLYPHSVAAYWRGITVAEWAGGQLPKRVAKWL